MRQIDCSDISQCSGPVLHTLVWSANHYDRESEQRPELGLLCGLGLLPMSCGIGADGHCRPPPGARYP